MGKIFLFDLESVETRYTKQWKTHLPLMLSEKTNADSVIICSGGNETRPAPPGGAFLNFFDTCHYKIDQMAKFLVNDINDGDVVLFTDAWNPLINMVRYLIELTDKKVKIHSIWHAGSYDPNDFLGRINRLDWAKVAEQSFFLASDVNYFATQFHIDLFTGKNPNLRKETIVRTGFPMEYLVPSTKDLEKKMQVVFPHRIAPEKQPDFFKNILKLLPEHIKGIICQEQSMTKEEYHKTLSESMVVFSANLQETLGIGVYEGMISGCIPIVPDRLSYVEMYPEIMRYESDMENCEDLAKFIINICENYGFFRHHISFDRTVKKLQQEFFSGDIMYQTINKDLH